MRLWHKDLIGVLPQKQLVSQWRELSAICRRIKLVGSPKHGLVNKVMDYPVEHFIEYSELVYAELLNRKIKINKNVRESILSIINQKDLFSKVYSKATDKNGLFHNWHNYGYLRQCYYNLEEKFECGMVSSSEFERIRRVFIKETEYLEAVK